MYKINGKSLWAAGLAIVLLISAVMISGGCRKQPNADQADDSSTKSTYNGFGGWFSDDELSEAETDAQNTETAGTTGSSSGNATNDPSPEAPTTDTGISGNGGTSSGVTSTDNPQLKPETGTTVPESTTTGSSVSTDPFDVPFEVYETYDTQEEQMEFIRQYGGDIARLVQYQRAYAAWKSSGDVLDITGPIDLEQIEKDQN